MSPPEVRALIEGIIEARLMPQWYLIVISLVGAAILGGVIAFVSAYLQVKAQNFANREDLNKLTEQLRETTRATEAIKAEISSEHWIKQKRWDLKLQCYSHIVENLGEIASTLSDTARTIARPIPKSGDPKKDEEVQKEQDAAVRAYLDRLRPAGEKLRRYSSVARIAVVPEVRTLLSRFADDWNAIDNEAPPLIEALLLKYERAHKAWVEVLDAARADLYGENKEGNG